MMPEWISLLDWSWLLFFLGFVWAPKTWTPGELVTASSLNTNIRDHLNESLRTQTTTLTGNQDDFALDGPFVYLKCNNASALTIRGALIDSGNLDGARIIVVNVAASSVTFANEDAGSATANRFLMANGEDLVIALFGAAQMIYDGTTSRWHVGRLVSSEIWEKGGYVGVGTASPTAKLDVEINESGVYAGRFFNDQASAGHGLLVETDATGVGSTAFFVTTDKAGASHVALKILGNGKIGIGAGPTTSTELAVASTTGAFLLPRMTTTQRDALTPLNGMVIYNTTTNVIEARENGAWVNI